MAKGYVGTGIPMKEGFTGKKNPTSDLYMRDGVPCGDIEATGASGKGPSGAGSGPKVGGYSMPANNKFTNGIPNAGRESIMSEQMSPAHKDNVKDSVLDTKEDSKWGGIITPQNMAAKNTFGV